MFAARRFIERSVACSAILAAAATLSSAKDPVFPPVPPGFRIGMELELTAEAFKNIAGDFDFDRLQTERGEAISPGLPKHFFDNYLRDSPRALEDLKNDPRSALLYEKLTQGLQLSGTVVHRERAFIDPRGQALEGPAPGESRIILPSSTRGILRASKPPPGSGPEPRSLILPERAPPEQAKREPVASFQQQGELELPKREAWQTLYARWKALDPSTKNSFVRWENLSPIKKSELALDYASSGSNPNAVLKLKADLPPREKALFENFYWSRDGDAIEFRHREDLHVSDPQAFYRDVLDLAKLAGVERMILDPDGDRLKRALLEKPTLASLHYHISIPNKDLSEQARELNHLALVRRIHLGILSDLDRVRNYIYTDTIHAKGLVRQVSPNRIEIRSHDEPLAEELGFVIRALSLDDHDGIEMIRNETKRLMTDYVAEKIAELRPEFLEEFSQYMTPEQRRRYPDIRGIRSFLMGIPLKPNATLPDYFWREAPWLVEIDNPDISFMLRQILSRHQWPESFWEKVPALLDHAQPIARLTVVKGLAWQKEWPDSVREQIPKLLTDSDLEIQKGAAAALRAQDHAKSPSSACLVSRLREWVGSFSR